MVMRLPRRLRSTDSGRPNDAVTHDGPRLVGEPAQIIDWPGERVHETPTGVDPRTARANIRMKQFSGLRGVDVTEYTGRFESTGTSPAAILKELLNVLAAGEERSRQSGSSEPFVLEIRIVG